MLANRVLFVDDDPSQRLTLPAVLRLHGFEVCAAPTVAQALAEMTTQKFDVLISDLNIGEPGDGFTVVSAMRRTQPDCINLIVTGFPAFESALAAIQQQVDDFLLKPARIDKLVEMIHARLREKPPHHHPMAPLRLAQLMRASAEEILDCAARAMQSNAELAAVAQGDRLVHIPALLAEIIRQMESPAPDQPTYEALALCREHGRRRSAAGYSIGVLVSETRTLDAAIYDIVRQRLLVLDTTNLMLDLKRLNYTLYALLEEASRTFVLESTKPRPKRLEHGYA